MLNCRCLEYNKTFQSKISLHYKDDKLTDKKLRYEPLSLMNMGNLPALGHMR